MTHSYEWQDSFICDKYEWVMSYMNKSCHSCLIGSMTWHIHIGHDSFICETWPIWPIHMYMTWHIHIGHDSYSYRPWLWHDIFISAMTPLYARRDPYDPFICTWLIYMCDMSEVTCVYEASYSCTVQHTATHTATICVTWVKWLVYVRRATVAIVVLERLTAIHKTFLD